MIRFLQIKMSLFIYNLLKQLHRYLVNKIMKFVFLVAFCLLLGLAKADKNSELYR